MDPIKPEKDSVNLTAQLYHIDGRVNAMESQMTALGGQLNRIEQHLLNSGPEPANYGVWAALTLSALVAMGGLSTGIVNYVGLQLEYLRSTDSRVEASYIQLDSRLRRVEEITLHGS